MTMKLPSLVLCLLSVADFGFAEATRYAFPDDPAVLNAQRDFGAKGDGKTDDTKALQRAIEASCGNDKGHRGKTNALYLPNGTYRLTSSLVVKAALGPWLYGESRAGVILKLDDGVKDVTAVLRTHPNEKGPTSADWFMRNLRHFTIDVGKNPETDGIRWYATNTGTLQDVRIIGKGKVGVNSGFLDQTGPNLVQDVEIDGFETGILTQWNWSETLSRVTIKNCRKQGLYVSATVIAAEDLVVENTPLGVMVDVPNGWDHWCGVLALTGGTFSGGDGKTAAIINKGKLYARNVKATGFSQAIDTNGSNGKVEGLEVTEFSSSKPRKLWEEAPNASLGLPIKREPVVDWELDPAKWLCADDYGVTSNDNEDDSAAIQKALDAAAAKGATTVYFRGCGGAEPNWFKLDRPVRVPAPVRMLMGLGWARLLGGKEGGFVVDDGSAPFVKFQNLDSFGGPPIMLTNAASKQTMLVESCGVRVIGTGTGDIFLTDVPGTLDLKKSGQHCWARQFNPEGTTDDGLVRNQGGTLWCLGVKHEGKGVRFSTSQGGRTEVLGLFNYGGTKEEMDSRPSFIINDASFTVAGMRELAFDQHTALNKVRETRSGETRVLDKHQPGAEGWISWSLFSGWQQDVVTYGTKGETKLTMDVLRPAKASNQAGVIMIASGGWASSRGAINQKYAAHFLDRGYTVFAVVHGSHPQFHIPEIIPDVPRAVRYLRCHAKEYGVDPQRIGVTGASSGGHLALLAGTQGSPGVEGAEDPVDRESSAVQAVACFFPPTDFLNYVKPNLNAMDESVLKNYRKFIGDIPADLAARDALGRRISPIYGITGKMPPTLIIHGEKDQHVLLHQSSSFIEAATKAGATAKLIVKPNQAHGWPDMGPDVEVMADWFDRYLVAAP